MSDTIAAIATPGQPSAIGILRLSGPDTCAALDAVFRAKNGRPAAQQRPRAMVLGELLDETGQVIDSVLCVRFPAPHSYTGEDCAELHCHGSPIVLDTGLRALFAAGCRQAGPGEFTKRAFLNGQLDLLQAESVADLIDAETAQQAHNAVCQLDGALSRTVARIYDGLMDMAARFYAVVDYPDEDIEDLQREQMLDTLRRAQNDLEALVAGFSRGRLLKLGVPTVLLGKPNAGKSSLLNALLGYDRAIVTDIAGTTRDSIHTRYNKFGMDFYLVDTAGMRKKGKTMEDLEFYSVMRSIRAIENSDVCILMLDAQQGLESQDLNIHNLIVRNRKGCVIVVNKWDLIEKDNNTMKEWTEFLKKKLAPFNDIPIIFTSVLSKQRIFDVLQTAIRVYQSRKRRISTSELNDFLLPLIENYPPPATKGKYIKIKYVTQLPTPTPQFAFFVNLPQYIKEPYRRFLENNMRDHWDFSGVPVQIYFRQK